MNILSSCCNKEIVPGTRREYPLGDRTWYQTVKVDCCEECGDECDPVEACDKCGEACEGLKGTKLGDLCPECINDSVNELSNLIAKHGYDVLMGA